jgi:hypothetical protein
MLAMKKYTCTNCGKTHTELPALGFSSPHYYEILSETDKQEMAELKDDFCVIYHDDQTDYFIKGVLTIPVIDSCETLEYGIWVSLSEKSFEEYEQNYDIETNEPAYFGRICNEIEGYEESTLLLHANVQVRNGGIRPEIIPHKADHNLVKEWENGISVEEAMKRIGYY